MKRKTNRRLTMENITTHVGTHYGVATLDSIKGE